MCVALSCAWLFSLSYMLAIVHSEFQELSIDLKKCKYDLDRGILCMLIFFFCFVLFLFQLNTAFL